MNSKPVQFKHHINLIPGSVGRCVAYNPTGELLAVGTLAGVVFIYRVRDWEILHSLENSYSVEALAWSPDDDFIATGSFDGPIKIWSTSDWLVKHTLEDSDEALNLAWSSDGKYLASGNFPGGDGTYLGVWDTSTWIRLKTEHIKQPRYISFNPESTALAIDYDEKGIEIISLPSFKKAAFLDFSDTEEHVSIYDPAWNSDGSLIAASRGDGIVRIWQTSDWTVITTIQVHKQHKDGEYGSLFSPDDQFLLSGGVGEPKIINTKDWTIIDPFDKGTVVDYFSKAWHPNNKQLALVLRYGSPIEIWDIV